MAKVRAKPHSGHPTTTTMKHMLPATITVRRLVIEMEMVMAKEKRWSEMVLFMTDSRTAHKMMTKTCMAEE